MPGLWVPSMIGVRMRASQSMFLSCIDVSFSPSLSSYLPLSLKINKILKKYFSIVTLFLISMSLVIFCLLFSLVDYVPVKGEMGL